MRIHQLLTLCLLSTLVICCESDSEEAFIEEALAARDNIDDTPTDTVTMDTMPGDMTPEVLVTYIDDIKPIIDANCAVPFCHTPPTNAGGNSFDNFNNVAARSARINVRINSTSNPMPPGSREKLSQEQRDLIADWIDDGLLEQ